MQIKEEIVRRSTYIQVGGVGNAYIDQLPGDESGIAIMSGVYIPPDQRGDGIGSKQHEERLQWLKENGFEAVLCTVNIGNKPQLKILKKNGWEKIADFQYSSMWVKKL